MGTVRRHAGTWNLALPASGDEVAVDREQHDHLICEVCGRVIAFSEREIDRLQEEIAAAVGFALSHHRQQLFGRCAACRPGAPAR